MEMKGNKGGETRCNKTESSLCCNMKEMVFAEALMTRITANYLV